MNNVVIFGVNGFIGSHCATQLMASGYNVYGVDVQAKSNTSGVTYFQSIDSPTLLKSLFSEHQFLACVNAAGAAVVGASFNDPLNDFELNVHLVMRQLEAIRLYQPAVKFIQFSSASVYGNPKVLPVNEQAPIQPISPYAYHKHLAETICHEYMEMFGVKTVIFRIFSAYGPGLRKQLLWDIYTKFKAGTISLFGTGNESRDYIFATDVGRAAQHAIESTEVQGVFNLASGEETTISTVADKLVQKLSSECQIGFTGEALSGAPKNWQADVAKLAATGFKTVIDLEQGLTATAHWMLEQKNG